MNNQYELKLALINSVEELHTELSKIRDKYEDQGEDVILHYSKKLVNRWFAIKGGLNI